MSPLPYPRFWRLALLSSFLGHTMAVAEPGPTPAGGTWQELQQQLRSTRNFRLGAPFNVHVLEGGERVLYQKAIPPSTAAAVYEFNRTTGVETKVATQSAGRTLDVEDPGQRATQGNKRSPALRG